MPYRLVLSPAADKALDALPQPVQSRIADKILTLSDNPRPPSVKALQGAKGFLRLRIGDYRVVYQVEDARSLVKVVKIAHRRDVYRQF